MNPLSISFQISNTANHLIVLHTSALAEVDSVRPAACANVELHAHWRCRHRDRVIPSARCYANGRDAVELNNGLAVLTGGAHSQREEARRALALQIR